MIRAFCRLSPASWTTPSRSAKNERDNRAAKEDARSMKRLEMQSTLENTQNTYTSSSSKCTPTNLMRIPAVPRSCLLSRKGNGLMPPGAQQPANVNHVQYLSRPLDCPHEKQGRSVVVQQSAAPTKIELHHQARVPCRQTKDLLTASVTSEEAPAQKAQEHPRVQHTNTDRREFSTPTPIDFTSWKLEHKPTVMQQHGVYCPRE